jgi:hypothetical protein
VHEAEPVLLEGVTDMSRQPALRVELELLDRAIETLFILPEDLAVARIPDTQGLGGSSGGLPAESSPRPEQ